MQEFWGGRVLVCVFTADLMEMLVMPLSLRVCGVLPFIGEMDFSSML
jgi:hypothetical protein